jgi:hypothetical protein
MPYLIQFLLTYDRPEIENKVEYG